MEKFNVATVAAVTGYTTATINSWAAKLNKTTKDGLNVSEVIEFLKAPKHNNERSKIDENAAQRLRIALEVMGAIQPAFKLEA